MHEPSVLKNPFTSTPPIRGYLGYAYLLSILFAQENPPWPWLYNQYIAIGARRDYSRFEQIATDWMGVYEGAMQYYFMELPVEQVADPDQGLQAILSLLRRGYYVYGEFNERYVPHTSSYRRRDFRHCYCLYGYSREQHLLFSAAYSDARRYEELEIPFSDYLRALAESGREKITIDFYRCNPAFVPVFDPESCAFRIREYLESRPCTQTYGDPHEYSGEEWLFGAKAQRYLLCYLEKVREMAGALDLRYFYFLWDHKKLMWMRIQYMMEQGFLPDKPVLLGYEQVEEQAALLKEMALKYNISLDCGLKKPEHLVQKMETYLQNLADREERILEEVLRAMRQPRNTH